MREARGDRRLDGDHPTRTEPAQVEFATLPCVSQGDDGADIDLSGEPVIPLGPPDPCSRHTSDDVHQPPSTVTITLPRACPPRGSGSPRAPSRAGTAGRSPASPSRRSRGRRGRDLDRERADAAGRAVDQHLLARLELRAVAEGLQCGDPGHGQRRGLVETEARGLAATRCSPTQSYSARAPFPRPKPSSPGLNRVTLLPTASTVPRSRRRPRGPWGKRQLLASTMTSRALATSPEQAKFALTARIAPIVLTPKEDGWRLETLQ